MTEFANVILIGLAVIFAVGTVSVCVLGAILDGKTQRRADALRQAERAIPGDKTDRRDAQRRGSEQPLGQHCDAQ